MTSKIFAAALLAVTLSGGLSAQEENNIHFKPYGFIRNYAVVDTRESVYGVEDFFYYVPKDSKIVNGEDLNAQRTYTFAALTSRLGLDISGYRINGWDVAAKFEGDFYAGVSGATGTALFRMRQAYMTLAKGSFSVKIGQAWHPMATDLPHVMSLNSGAPFGPFSRTPQLTMEGRFSESVSLTVSALWQMQYTSAGPNGASADYIKYSGIPELFLGLNFKSGGFTGRMGVDMLSIRPRHLDATGKKKVSDRLTTFSPYLYAEYSQGLFNIKAKTIFAQAGEHMNLNGGYGVSAINADGSWEYTPTRNSSSWVSMRYGKKVQGVLFCGYVRNFGTKDPLVGSASDYLYFSKNSFSNMTQMYRVEPELVYNLGKVAFGLQYELTGIEYGQFVEANAAGSSRAGYGLATDGLHWVTNNRILLMAKFTF